MSRKRNQSSRNRRARGSARSGSSSQVVGFTSQAALSAAQARGDSRLNAGNQTVLGRSPGSVGNRYDPINSNNMGDVEQVNLPTPPETPNYNGANLGNMTEIASMLGGTLTNGQITNVPNNTQNAVQSSDSSTPQGRLQNYMSTLGLAPKRESVLNDPAYLRQQRSVERERRNVNEYTANLNSIVARSQADQLSLVGQGRGVTESLIGGQQAQISREAAIQSLPVQAQIAAAQGNLDMAERSLDQLFQIRSTELQNDFEYKSNIYNSIRGFLDKEETREMGLLDQSNNRKYQEEQNNLSSIESWTKIALSANRPDLIPKFSRLDPNSPTFRQDFARLQAQIGSGDAGLSGSNFDVESVYNGELSGVENNNNILQGIFRSNKISAANKTFIGNGLSLSKAASDLAEANPTGKFASFYPFRKTVDFFLPKFLKREKTVSNDALISALDLQTQFWASGAALSEGQTELVRGMIPQKDDTNKAVRQKTNQLVNYMLSQTASRLTTDGVNFRPAKVNLFEISEWLNALSPEQRRTLKAQGLI